MSNCQVSTSCGLVFSGEEINRIFMDIRDGAHCTRRPAGSLLSSTCIVLHCILTKFDNDIDKKYLQIYTYLFTHSMFTNEFLFFKKYNFKVQ